MLIFEKILSNLSASIWITLIVCFFVYIIAKEIIWFFKEFWLIDRALPRNEREMKLADWKRVLMKMGVQFKRAKKDKKDKKSEEEPGGDDTGKEPEEW